MVNKIVTTEQEALEGLESGMSLAVGGFGICGNPVVLIDAIVEKGTDELEIYSNNPGTQIGDDHMGLAKLFINQRARKFGGSYIGFNKEFERQFLAGELEVELIPQGTLAEKMRAGGAGIPAFFTATGAGTMVADGGLPVRYDGNGTAVVVSAPKETRVMSHRGKEQTYVLEESITTDFALVRAAKADREGNLVFNLTAANFNANVAMCGGITVVEAEEIVEVGELSPDEIHLPGIFVDRVLPLTREQAENKRIERIIIRDDAEEMPEAPRPEGRLGWTREQMAARAARELHDGEYVNLGIGMPTMVPDYLPKGVNVILQSENGLLKTGPSPRAHEVHPDVINAGKATVTILPGGSTFDSATSFAMIRGGYVDTAILGALQVSATGDIANWGIPGKKFTGMGGAMDLVKGANRVVVMLDHTSVDGDSKVLNSCTYPLTAEAAVDLIITNLAVFEVTPSGLVLCELAPGVTLAEVEAATEADFIVRDDLTEQELVYA